MTDTSTPPVSPVPVVLEIRTREGGLLRMAKLDYTRREDRAVATAEVRWAVANNHLVSIVPAPEE